MELRGVLNYRVLSVELRGFWCGSEGVELRGFRSGTEGCVELGFFLLKREVFDGEMRVSGVELRGFGCGTERFRGLKMSGTFAWN